MYRRARNRLSHFGNGRCLQGQRAPSIRAWRNMCLAAARHIQDKVPTVGVPIRTDHTAYEFPPAELVIQAIDVLSSLKRRLQSMRSQRAHTIHAGTRRVKKTGHS